MNVRMMMALKKLKHPGMMYTQKVFNIFSLAIRT